MADIGDGLGENISEDEEDYGEDFYDDQDSQFDESEEQQERSLKPAEKVNNQTDPANIETHAIKSESAALDSAVHKGPSGPAETKKYKTGAIGFVGNSPWSTSIPPWRLGSSPAPRYSTSVPRVESRSMVQPICYSCRGASVSSKSCRIDGTDTHRIKSTSPAQPLHRQTLAYRDGTSYPSMHSCPPHVGKPYASNISSHPLRLNAEFCHLRETMASIARSSPPTLQADCAAKQHEQKRSYQHQQSPFRFPPQKHPCDQDGVGSCAGGVVGLGSSLNRNTPLTNMHVIPWRVAEEIERKRDHCCEEVLVWCCRLSLTYCYCFIPTSSSVAVLLV
jgi:hypothetical protein